jgi:hypothetical protein
MSALRPAGPAWQRLAPRGLLMAAETLAVGGVLQVLGTAVLGLPHGVPVPATLALSAVAVAAGAGWAEDEERARRAGDSRAPSWIVPLAVAAALGGLFGWALASPGAALYGALAASYLQLRGGADHRSVRLPDVRAATIPPLIWTVAGIVLYMVVGPVGLAGALTAMAGAALLLPALAGARSQEAGLPCLPDVMRALAVGAALFVVAAAVTGAPLAAPLGWLGGIVANAIAAVLFVIVYPLAWLFTELFDLIRALAGKGPPRKPVTVRSSKGVHPKHPPPVHPNPVVFEAIALALAAAVIVLLVRGMLGLARAGGEALPDDVVEEILPADRPPPRRQRDLRRPPADPLRRAWATGLGLLTRAGMEARPSATPAQLSRDAARLLDAEAREAWAKLSEAYAWARYGPGSADAVPDRWLQRVRAALTGRRRSQP